MYRLPKIAFASLMLVACERAEPVRVAPVKLPVSAEIPVEGFTKTLPPAPPAMATPMNHDVASTVVERADPKTARSGSRTRKAAASQNLKNAAPPEAVAKPVVEVPYPAGISRRAPVWNLEQARQRVTVTKAAPTNSVDGESP